MPLVVEDGSLVSGAVTYVTVAEARAFAAARGVTLPVADADVEVLLIKAMDYLASREDSFQGQRVDPEQALAWPRKGVTLYGSAFPEDAIPNSLKLAQSQLTLDALTTDLMPNGSGREIVRQKVDVIETEYAPTGSGSVLPQLNKALALLEPLLRAGSAGMFANVIRV